MTFTTEEQARIQQDIENFPEFMASFYQRRLDGTENLTQTDALETDRLAWKHNRDKALSLLAAQTASEPKSKRK